jgi:heat shock protein HtpX
MIKFVNNMKTVLLMGGLMGLCLLVGSRFGQQGLIIALVLGGAMNIGAWFFSDTIAIKSMRGVEVLADTPGIGGEMYHQVDELRQRAGLPMPRVYICPHEAPNAFATGRSPSHAAVCVTEGALRLLSLDELRGVLGHELAHVQNRDTLTSCIAAVMAGVLMFFSRMAMWFGGGFGGGREQRGHPLAGLLMLIFAPLAAALIKAMISRSREYVADNQGAKIAGSPDGLISALRKLEAMSQRVPLNNPNPAMNSLFIVEPFTGRSLMNLFASHPETEKRVAALMSLREEMSARGDLR